MANRLRPIGYKKYLLGTDDQGRDVVARLIYGFRISILFGLILAAIAVDMMLSGLRASFPGLT